MSYGFVYCLRHPYMPKIFKIGMTERSPMQRCAELSASTSVPCEFEILFYAEVEDPRMVERETHQAFCEQRVSESREFFQVDVRDVLKFFQVYSCHILVTNDGDEELALAEFHQKTAIARIVKDIDEVAAKEGV